MDPANTRVSPMSIGERELLIELVGRENIIHSRKTDRKIVAAKQEAWARVTEHFNSHGLGTMRTLQQLKSAWERLKMK